MFQNEAVRRLDAVNIVSLVSAMRNEEVLANQHRELEGVSAERIKKLLEERAQGRPLAYITNKKEFFSEEIYVDERVLIPRPETELLVEESLKILEEHKGMRHIIDMGTGSGAIGAIVAKRALKEVLCIDISIEALRVAQYNARRLSVSEKTTFLCSNLFDGLRGTARFDMVIANLPYVAVDEWDGLMEDVKRYEPKTALLGGEEGTEIYERFIEGLPGHLAEGGCVLCEIGGARQAATIGASLGARGFAVVSKRDLSGVERALIGTWTRLS